MRSIIRYVVIALAALILSGPRSAIAGPYHSIAPEFIRFVDTTKQMPEAARIALFRKRFDALFPGFYEPRASDPAKYDARVAKAFADFPAIRPTYIKTIADFGRAYAAGQAHFRKTFPDYHMTMPVYLVHSLGEMDGGTRVIRGKTVMVFGADIIARIHDETTIGPFLDHELFHVYHAKYFPDCDALWCSLWQEGLAVYVASQMNPGATDRQLALTQPRPIRPEVEPRLAEAMCRMRAKFESTDQADYAPFFFGKPNDGPFPPRYGYFLGYLLAKQIGERMSLTAMAKLPPAQVKPLLEKALGQYGPCKA